MKLKIESNIPPPKNTKRARYSWKQIFSDFKINQSILLPSYQDAANGATQARLRGFKVIWVKVENGFRLWRIK